jgi:hypothetical protein
MQRFGIVRDGKTFIVQAEQQGVLKCASWRQAARTIADANDLMRANAAPDLIPAAHATPNNAGLSSAAESDRTPAPDSRVAVAS